MLHDRGFSFHLWEEACNITVYMHNRSPRRILNMITPEEVVSRRKRDVCHLNIFGATVYFHVSKESRKKLEHTTEMGVFLGYTETPHSYRCIFPHLG